VNSTVPPGPEVGATADPASQELRMTEGLKVLFEFMRIKSPEINIRQNQLARIIFIFFLLNIFLFLVITTGIGSLSIRLKDPVNVSDLIYIHEPRVFIVLGATLVVFFYFVRFGYLFLQTLKEVASTQNVIDRVLPHGNYPTLDIREALMQTCRSNYIVQTLVVFLYPDRENERKEFVAGPLSGSTRRRGMFIKFVMILTTIAVEWIIAVSQFMMIVVFLAFTKWIFSLFLFFAFFLYYGFYFEYALRAAIRLKWESWITSITAVAGVLILYSLSANAYLVFYGYQTSPDVFTCRMTLAKIREISPPVGVIVSFLFKEPTKEQRVHQAQTDRDVEPCPLGKN